MTSVSPQSGSRHISTQALHVQLRESIRAEILGGKYKPGGRIPTEAEMITNYGVSKITVRRAVQDLTTEGLLIGHRGKGMFVNSSKFAIAYNLLFVHASETPLQSSYTQMLMNGINSENSDARPFRLELIGRTYTELQSDDDDTLDQLVKFARIDGIIALPRLRESQAKRLADLGIPVAVIEHTGYSLPPGFITVETGPSDSLDYQAQHIKEIGARRVGVITDQMLFEPMHLSQVQESMRKFGLPVITDAYERAEFGSNSAHAATLRLLRRIPDLDAIIAVDDLAAMGSLHACYQLGIRVPEQVAIIGRGNMLGEHSHCGITTVDNHIERHGKLAARAILRSLAGDRIESQILIEPMLLRRATTQLRY